MYIRLLPPWWRLKGRVLRYFPSLAFTSFASPIPLREGLLHGRDFPISLFQGGDAVFKRNFTMFRCGFWPLRFRAVKRLQKFEGGLPW